jgi:uncharacterized protein (DUF697 family)
MGGNSSVGAQIVGGIAAFGIGIIVVASIYQLNKGSIPSTAGSTTTSVVSDLFSS